MKRNKITTVIFAGMLLTACQQNPDSGIVVHKDMEKVIAEAENSNDSKVELAEMQTPEFDSYTADIQNAQLRVNIKANAKVDIPQIDRLSLLRVEQHKFSQEECDRIRTALMGDMQLLDVTKFHNITPRVRIEEALRVRRDNLQTHLDRLQNDPEYVKQWESGAFGMTAEEMTAEYQSAVDKLQSEYEEAPAVIDCAAYPSDGRLKTITDLTKENPDPDFLPTLTREWGESEILWALSEDLHAALYVRNSENLSNCVNFIKSPAGYCEPAIAYINMGSLCELQQKPGADVPNMPDETCTLSQEEAQAKADAFLGGIGVTDYSFSEGEKITYSMSCNTLAETNGAEEFRDYARTSYILRYKRMIDGAEVSQASGDKTNDTDIADDSYTRQDWPAEMIELHINDSGIVQFTWCAPLTVTETVVENAQMMPFDEIRGIFERMMPITAAQEIADFKVDISIDRVTLSYSRISERDAFDRGLIVPVWAFSGSRKVYADSGFVEEHQSYSGVQFAINAIDGSVIDGAIGY